jgi:hypothetical protein
MARKTSAPAEQASTAASDLRDIGLSVDGFRAQLTKEVETIVHDLGRSYDKEQDRGHGFEVGTAELLLRIEDIELDPPEVVYKSNDLKVDIAFDDEDSRTLALAQTKFPCFEPARLGLAGCRGDRSIVRFSAPADSSLHQSLAPDITAYGRSWSSIRTTCLGRTRERNVLADAHFFCRP